MNKLQLKQMIEEQLEGLMNEQGYAQQGQAAGRQIKSYKRQQTKGTGADKKWTTRSTLMGRGDFKADLSDQPQHLSTRLVSDKEQSTKGREATLKGDISDDLTSSQGNVADLTFKPWKGHVTTKSSEDLEAGEAQTLSRRPGQKGSYEKGKFVPQVPKAKTTKFIQPVPRGADTGQRVTESQLKQMIEEELIAELKSKTRSRKIMTQKKTPDFKS